MIATINESWAPFSGTKLLNRHRASSCFVRQTTNEYFYLQFEMELYYEKSNSSLRWKEDFAIAIIFSIMSITWLLTAVAESPTSIVIYWLIAASWIGATLSFLYKSRKNFFHSVTCVSCGRVPGNEHPLVRGKTRMAICQHCIMRIMANDSQPPAATIVRKPPIADNANPYSAPLTNSEPLCNFCGQNYYNRIYCDDLKPTAICDQCIDDSSELFNLSSTQSGPTAVPTIE